MVGDDTPFKIYVMKFKTKNGNRTSQIEEIRVIPAFYDADIFAKRFRWIKTDKNR